MRLKELSQIMKKGFFIYATQTRDGIELFYKEIINNPPLVSRILTS